MNGIAAAIGDLVQKIGRPVRLMEVCGTHTVAIFRHGIRDLLPAGVSLLSGPGCPVCVTAIADVDRAVALARQPGVLLATFGDLLRVPGSAMSLAEARAGGAQVAVVYSPLDALELAAANPGHQVVFFATGFETTSPLIAATLLTAQERATGNFSILSVHKLVPPALRALVATPELAVDGFLLPGHVSAIIGVDPYRFIAAEGGRPAVVTGFAAADILEGIWLLLRQLAAGAARVENQYQRVVRPEGNPRALALLDAFFEPADAVWRGLGTIPASGLTLKPAYAELDASRRLPVAVPAAREPAGCDCGAILRGLKTPPDCRLFGRACTPERPVGACMVSSEGSCAAYHRYGQRPAPPVGPAA
ncbi:MAG: hydrogenase formation protein HypD [Thermodesulfobacteriota bacterium]